METFYKLGFRFSNTDSEIVFLKSFCWRMILAPFPITTTAIIYILNLVEGDFNINVADSALFYLPLISCFLFV